MTNMGNVDALGRYGDVRRYKKPVGTFVSLYAGAGGLDIGFSLAGFAPVWVNELSPTALDTHDEVFKWLSEHCPHLANQDYVSHAGDLLELAEEDLPTLGMADLVIGGPPCQGFSVAGKMDPSDDRSKHVFHFIQVVKQVQPKMFVMENVKALYQNQRWAGIRKDLVEAAERLGYEVNLTLENASHFGVPQARERMFLVGVQRKLGIEIQEPIPITFNCPPTVRAALAQLPRWGEPGNDTFCTAKITPARAPVLRKSPYAGMIFNGAGRPLNLDAPSMTLPASMGGNKTPIVDQSLIDDPEKKSWVETYHANLWKNPESAVVSEIPAHLRRLTVEEAAAIQTFPIGMKWSGSRSAQFQQIGNAVPPRLALAVAESVKATMGLGQGVVSSAHDKVAAAI